ncbi:MAG: hypothetical protein SGBAC_009857 [Bacillariaceae sp.]
MVTLRPRNTKKETMSTKAVIAKKKSFGPGASKKMTTGKTAANSSKKKTTKAKSRPKTASKKKSAGYKVSNTSTASSLKGAKDPEGILQEYLTTKVADHESKHADIKELHALIRQNAPALVPELQGKTTLAYGGFDYVTKSKCTGRWSRLAIMVNKKGLSLMVCGYKDGKYLLEHYPKKKHFGKTLSIGKSCIRFAQLEDLNLEHIGEVLEEATSTDVSAMFA